MTRTFLYAPHPDDFGRVLLRVQFLSPVDLPRNSGDYYEVKVGVARGAKTDNLGTYTGSAKIVTANVAFDITGPDDISEPVGSGQVVVADLTVIGSPVGLQGGGCMVHIGPAATEPPGAGVSDVLEHFRLAGNGGDRFFVPLAVPA